MSVPDSESFRSRQSRHWMISKSFSTQRCAHDCLQQHRQRDTLHRVTADVISHLLASMLPITASTETVLYWISCSSFQQLMAACLFTADETGIRSSLYGRRRSAIAVCEDNAEKFLDVCVASRQSAVNQLSAARHCAIDFHHH